MPIASDFGALSESNDQPSQVTAMENSGMYTRYVIEDIHVRVEF